MTSWFGFRAIGGGQLTTALFLLLIYVFIGFQSDLLYGGFWCSGRYSLGIAVTSTTRLIEFVALVTTVIMGGGPVQAAEAYLVGRIAGTVMTRLALRRATPWLHYGLGRISVQEIRRLARPAFASIAFPLGNALNIQAMRLVVGLVLGPVAVAVFAPLRTLSNLTTRPGAVINGVIEPELAVAFGRGDRAVFSQLFLRGCQAAIWLSISAALTLTLVARWLWPVWTGGRIPMEWPLFVTLLGAGILNSLWYTALMVPYATNRHGRIAIVYTGVYGAMAVVVAYVAALNSGLVGVGAALLAAELLMTVYVLPTSLAMDQQHWGTWLATAIRPPTFIFSEALAVAHRLSVARGTSGRSSRMGLVSQFFAAKLDSLAYRLTLLNEAARLRAAGRRLPTAVSRWLLSSPARYDDFIQIAGFIGTETEVTLVDIGANIGRWAADFCRFFPRTTKVYCFEPNPELQTELARTTAPLPNTRILPFALG